MKRWIFCVICIFFGCIVSVFLLFLERKYHFKQTLIKYLHLGWFTFIAYLVFFAFAIIAILIDNDLVESPVFLGILLGFFYFLLPRTIV